MTIPLLDLENLARACTDGDLAAFAAAHQLGWTLTEPAREALLRAIANTNYHGWFSSGVSAFTLAQAIGLMAEAATNASGVAITEQARALRLGKEIAIAFRDDEQIHFGVRYASNLPMTPGHVWSELKPWFKVLERNRKVLERWAESAEGIVSVPLTNKRAQSAPASGAELLAAVIAEPSKVTHRLVYADWLLSQGDARGELIQLCEQRWASSEPDPQLNARITELERAYGERIAGDVAQLASDYSLERGFVARIEMAAPTFAKHGARLLATHPIRRLALKPVNAQALARLARAEALRGLRMLYLSQIIGRIRPIPLDELCASPYFDALEDLQIWNWACAGDPTAAFERLHAPRLTSMMLYEVEGASMILAGLARNLEVRLRELQVDLRERERWSPLTSSAFAELRTLKLDLHGDDAVQLLTKAHLPALTELEVRNELPLERIHLPTLRKLDLGGGEITAAALTELLARLPHLRALRIWELEGLDVNRAMESLLALPAEHPLVAVGLPLDGAEHDLTAQLRQRFSADFHAVGAEA